MADYVSKVTIGEVTKPIKIDFDNVLNKQFKTINGNTITGTGDIIINELSDELIDKLDNTILTTSTGTSGQILTKTANGAEWKNKPTYTASEVGALSDTTEVGDKNIIESIKYGDETLTITDKTVTIPESASGYNKPAGGIPKTDLSSGVQASLDKADSALQSYTEVYTGTYTKPENGIPKTDLESSVLTSLGKADTALQQSNVSISGNTLTIGNKEYTPTGLSSSDVTSETVAGWGYTKNTGTITGITMNGSSMGTSGNINLGNVLVTPSGGTVGQVLKKTSTGTEWSDDLQSETSNLPTSTTSDAGKVLKVSNSGTPQWDEDDIGEGLPSSTTSDSGKILKVNESGNAEWNTNSILIVSYDDEEEMLCFTTNSSNDITISKIAGDNYVTSSAKYTAISNDELDWSVSGDCATITSTGLLTVNSNASNNTVVVTAKSRTNPTVTQEKQVVVNYNSSSAPELVDLGLPSKLKWMKYNLGVSDYSEDDNNIYQWGQLAPNTKLTDYTNTVTSMCHTDSWYGVDKYLNKEYDIIYQKFGERYRIASWDDAIDLILYCKSSYDSETDLVKIYNYKDETKCIYFKPGKYWLNTDCSRYEQSESGIHNAYVLSITTTTNSLKNVDEELVDLYFIIEDTTSKTALLPIRGVYDTIIQSDTNQSTNISGLTNNYSESLSYIDLGLPSGTKWADRNVDASSVGTAGSYYSASETNSGNILEFAELFATCYSKLDDDRNNIILTGPNGKQLVLPFLMNLGSTEEKGYTAYLTSDLKIDFTKLIAEEQYYKEESVDEFKVFLASGASLPPVTRLYTGYSEEDESISKMILFRGGTESLGVKTQLRNVESHLNNLSKSKYVVLIDYTYHPNADSENVTFAIWTHNPDFTYRFLTDNVTVKYSELTEIESSNIEEGTYKYYITSYISHNNDDWNLRLVVDETDTTYGKVSGLVTKDSSKITSE